MNVFFVAHLQHNLLRSYLTPQILQNKSSHWEERRTRSEKLREIAARKVFEE